MKIRILDSAQDDLTDGFWFYENQNAGLGMYFLEALFSDIDALHVLSGVHEIHFDKYYRSLSKRFPFAIYYRIEQDKILVIAILDCRKNPAWNRNRLK